MRVYLVVLACLALFITMSASVAFSGQPKRSVEKDKASETPSERMQKSYEGYSTSAASSREALKDLETVVVTGSRTITDITTSPVPVDTIKNEELVKTGQNELGRAIQVAIPAFNFSSSTISDGTDSVRPATLRGMGPDQVLLLVNGKRRHGSALIHVNTSVGRGTAGYDINSIPISAVDRVEVLRDGASALYGSDAISGVINIILKSDYEGAVSTSYGKTYEGDGDQFIARFNKGFSVGSDGVLHLASEFRYRDRTNRAGLSGEIQYPDSESFSLCDSTELTNEKYAECIADTDFDSALNTELLGQGFDGGTTVLLTDPDDKERNFNRQNFRIGDAESKQISGAFNFEKPMGVSGGIYSFGSLSRRENTSGGFYRRANQLDRNPAGSTYPDGFLPLIETTVWDFSLSTGITYEFDSGLEADLGVTHGGNTFNFTVANSHNASWVYRSLNDDFMFESGGDPYSEVDFSGSPQTTADAGDLELYLTTVNLDFVIPQLDMFYSASLAWGAEYKRDNYKLKAGELYSYADYDGIIDGGGSAGIQVFPGFKPENEVDESRHAFSFYTEASIWPLETLVISPAVRYERYSDFGNTLNGKVSSKLDFADLITFRGSFSTGFRAPSMQQLYFNNTSTQFRDVGGTQTPFEVGTFRNDSAIAKAIGIPELDEETSINWSGGFVFKPTPNFSIATDFYYITVDDRIILSGQLKRPDPNDPDARTDLSDSVIDTLDNEGVSSAQFFMNAADTKTKGMDIVSTWRLSIPRGSFILKLAGTISETKITSVNLPAELPGSLYTAMDRSILEEWQPDSQFTLSADYQVDRLSFYLAVSRYGEYSVEDGGRQEYGPEYITDAQISFDMGRLGVLKVGSNNLFDVTPDENEIGQARGGTIIDREGNVIISSPGVFTYSRRSAPFGFNGGFYYVSFERSL